MSFKFLLPKSLLSVPQMLSHGYHVLFENQRYIILYPKGKDQRNINWFIKIFKKWNYSEVSEEITREEDVILQNEKVEISRDMTLQEVDTSGSTRRYQSKSEPQMVQYEDSVHIQESCFNVLNHLKSHDEAFEINTWRDAISIKVKMRHMNTTQKLVEKSKNKNNNNLKLIYHIKRIEYGNPIEYKARRMNDLKQNTKSLKLDKNSIKEKCWL